MTLHNISRQRVLCEQGGGWYHHYCISESRTRQKGLRCCGAEARQQRHQYRCDPHVYLMSANACKHPSSRTSNHLHYNQKQRTVHPLMSVRVTATACMHHCGTQCSAGQSHAALLNTPPRGSHVVAWHTADSMLGRCELSGGRLSR